MNLRKTVEEIDQKYHDRQVVLVDQNDTDIGLAGLVEAHRAFSLQLYRVVNGENELLLQQRAIGKPVFPYYWANTCCYNMAPGEDYLTRSVSRVKEEMGVEVERDNLRELYKFSYEALDTEGWCENELDNVIVGEWDGEVKINPEEAMDSKWIGWRELNKDMEQDPDKYAPWFKLIVGDPKFCSVFE
jgi:isopentenyl-diphosphate delta-isomerase